MLISLQVGVLIIFKYLNFFIETINTVIPTSVSTLNIIVPLGISFFTFQQIAYSVDVYRGEIEKRNFLDYLCFSFLFITISSGPIIYYNEIIPQLDDEKNHSVNSIAETYYDAADTSSYEVHLEMLAWLKNYNG